MIKIKSLVSILGIAIGSLAASGALTPAQAANLVLNGDFNQNNLTNAPLQGAGLGSTGSSGYTGTIVPGAGRATATGWNFGAGLNWLVSTGDAYKDNMDILGGRDYNYNNNATPWTMYGTASINSPNGTANWYVVADGDVNERTAISQTINGLQSNQQYEVSFYQAAGQQTGLIGGTTEQWDVTFGSTTKSSTLMSPVQASAGLSGGTATAVSSWQKETMIFTASGTTQTLSFLAKGNPTGKPPLSLLTGINVQPLPEPSEIVGTIVGFGACMVLRSKLKKKTATINK